MNNNNNNYNYYTMIKNHLKKEQKRNILITFLTIFAIIIITILSIITFYVNNDFSSFIKFKSNNETLYDRAYDPEEKFGIYRM